MHFGVLNSKLQEFRVSYFQCGHAFATSLLAEQMQLKSLDEFHALPVSKV